MKRLLILTLSLMILLAGCGAPATAPPVAEPINIPPIADEYDDNSTEEPEEDLPYLDEDFPILSGGTPLAPIDRLEGLVRDETSGIIVTAEVLERMAILPGMVFRVTVVVENTGDRTVTYTHGSGSWETPEAVFLRSGGLQPILPPDHLGVATMDFNIRELHPGESVRFSFNVIAIEPAEDFDMRTHNLFMENQTYIADLGWEDLQARYPDLTAVPQGSYTVEAFFLYTIADGDDPFIAFGGPTNYAMAVCEVGIS